MKLNEKELKKINELKDNRDSLIKAVAYLSDESSLCIAIRHGDCHEVHLGHQSRTIVSKIKRVVEEELAALDNNFKNELEKYETIA